MIFQDIPQIIIFYFTTLYFSLAGLSLTIFFFRKFPDKGYAFSRIIGLLATSIITWNISNYFDAKLTLPMVVVSSLTLLIIPLIIKGDLIPQIRGSLKTIVIEELLFILMFFGFILFRGAEPKIEGIEKFMDYAILNGIHRGGNVPPEDVWYSGERINYYYFGHYVLNTLVKLSGLPVSKAYNLLVSFIFASASTGIFSIVYLLTRKIPYALFGSLLLTLGGNLDYFYKVRFLNVENYFYADARSLIAHAITEFPAYSFFIGDLHAHILDIPFVLLFIALVCELYFEGRYRKGLTAAMVFSLGTLGVTNSWDLPIYGFVLFLTTLAISGIKNFKSNRKEIFTNLGIVFLIGILSILVFLPYYLNFQSPVGGVGLSKTFSGIGVYLRMFGYFLSFSLVFIFYLLTQKEKVKSDKLVLVLLVAAFCLMVAPDVIFLKDIYFKLNPPYFRANTVFKVWYQAWILFCIISAYSAGIIVALIKRSRFYAVVLAPILFLTFYVFTYSYVSIKYIIGPDYKYKGIDGTAYLYDSYKDTKKVIDWLNINVEGQPVLLEAEGNAYSMESIYSSYTGLPTIVGWSNHELGWRGDWSPIAYRMGDIEKMYKSNSAEEVHALLLKYRVKYAVIGETERTKYKVNGDPTLLKLGDIAVETPSTVLLKIRD